MTLLDLWLPIVVCAFVLFAASFVFWMVLPHHKKDIRPLANEGEVDAALAKLNIPPGMYMFPNCQNSADMKSDAFKARWKSGPWGTINLIGKQPNFGLNLAMIFVEFLLVSVLVAYLCSVVLPAGESYLRVFRVAGTAAVLGYVFGSFGGDFFMGKPVRAILTTAFDSIVYALLTAGVFGWLWPGLTVGA